MPQIEHEQAQNSDSTTSAPLGDCLTVPGVAREIHSSTRSVYRAIKRGKLKAARINDRGDLRIYRSWVEEWMHERAMAK
jgi:excisionase family DNA binding protein